MDEDLIRRVDKYIEKEEWDKAAQMMLWSSEQGEDDPNWHFKLGNIYYQSGHEEEAMAALNRALALSPENEEIQTLLGDCREAYQEKMGRRQEDYEPELYTQEELDAVEAYITTHFGGYPRVFHEIVSPDIHVDLCVVPPGEEWNYYTIVTMGMGAHQMNVPEELAPQKLKRAELVLYLPPDWRVHESAEIWYWPLRWLKALARMPGEQDTWLGFGHSVGLGRPFAENTMLCGSMLIDALGRDGKGRTCPLPNGEEVIFYQVIPLYQEEMDYKVSHDAEALLELMDPGALVLNPARPNYCKDMDPPQKNYLLTADEIRPLLTDWKGPRGCLATERITVDGCPVGYCYREEPMEGMPDSGWRFLAGDESDAYLDDVSHTDVFDLNTICNYDRDILPLLASPQGSGYVRDADGRFHPVKDE